VAAQVKLHEAGTTVFLAGDPPDDLHVVLGGSLSLHHKIHIAEPPVATEIGAVSESEDENSVPAGHGIVAVIGAGNIADYEDFVGGRLSRRLCATAGEGLLVLRISRGDYEESIQLQLEHEFSERMCALEGCGLFGGVPHKLRGSLAEMLQPRAYRRGATLTRAGEVVNRVILIQQGECVALGRRPGSAGRPAATDISGWRPTSGPRSARKPPEVELHRLGANDVFGERMLLSPAAAAVAVAATVGAGGGDSAVASLQRDVVYEETLKSCGAVVVFELSATDWCSFASRRIASLDPGPARKLGGALLDDVGNRGVGLRNVAAAVPGSTKTGVVARRRQRPATATAERAPTQAARHTAVPRRPASAGALQPRPSDHADRGPAFAAAGPERPASGPIARRVGPAR
jgi:CRP-like cAMP-binding protein